MGRVRPLVIKRLAAKLLEENKEKFSEDFERNKEIVKELVKIKSKKLRNVLAGYITSLVRSNRISK